MFTHTGSRWGSHRNSRWSPEDDAGLVGVHHEGELQVEAVLRPDACHDLEEAARRASNVRSPAPRLGGQSRTREPAILSIVAEFMRAPPRRAEVPSSTPGRMSVRMCPSCRRRPALRPQPPSAASLPPCDRLKQRVRSELAVDRRSAFAGSGTPTRLRRRRSSSAATLAPIHGGSCHGPAWAPERRVPLRAELPRVLD